MEEGRKVESSFSNPDYLKKFVSILHRRTVSMNLSEQIEAS